MAEVIISRDQAQAQGLKRYFTGVACKNGHIAERRTSNCVCVACSESSNKQYRIENADKVKAALAEWRAANPDLIKKHKRATYERNREKILARCKAYTKANLARIVARGREYVKRNKKAALGYGAKWRKANARQIAEARKARYQSDPAFRAQLSMRRLIDRAAIAAKTGRPGGNMTVLRYSKEEFMRHIARQFRPGMTWDNHGEWHIDHIIPIAKLIAEGEKDPAVINALTNLRPLWAQENLKKGSQQISLI